MLSPVFLPDDYSGYAGEEREMIAKAVEDADVKLGISRDLVLKTLPDMIPDGK